MPLWPLESKWVINSRTSNKPCFEVFIYGRAKIKINAVLHMLYNRVAWLSFQLLTSLEQRVSMMLFLSLSHVISTKEGGRQKVELAGYWYHVRWIFRQILNVWGRGNELYNFKWLAMILSKLCLLLPALNQTLGILSIASKESGLQQLTCSWPVPQKHTWLLQNQALALQ